MAAIDWAELDATVLGCHRGRTEEIVVGPKRSTRSLKFAAFNTLISHTVPLHPCAKKSCTAFDRNFSSCTSASTQS